MKRRVMPPKNHWGQDCKPCANPLCDRWVSPSVVNPYCCGGCQEAHKGKYEIHEDGLLGHSQFCNEKVLERGTQFSYPKEENR